MCSQGRTRVETCRRRASGLLTSAVNLRSSAGAWGPQTPRDTKPLCILVSLEFPISSWRHHLERHPSPCPQHTPARRSPDHSNPSAWPTGTCSPAMEGVIRQ